MLFWSVFLKTHFKKILAVKNAILAVFGGYYLFECIFKKIYQNNICASTVLFLKLVPLVEKSVTFS